MMEEREVLCHYYNHIFNCDDEDLVFALLNEEEDEIVANRLNDVLIGY